jgi:hypothetical protein
LPSSSAHGAHAQPATRASPDRALALTSLDAPPASASSIHSAASKRGTASAWMRQRQSASLPVSAVADRRHHSRRRLSDATRAARKRRPCRFWFWAVSVSAWPQRSCTFCRSAASKTPNHHGDGHAPLETSAVATSARPTLRSCMATTAVRRLESQYGFHDSHQPALDRLQYGHVIIEKDQVDDSCPLPP